MTTWRPLVAIAGLEARRIAAASGVVTLFGLLATVVVPTVDAGARAADVRLILATCAAATAALVLGAGTFSSGPGAGFVASRAISPVASLAARLLPRLAALALASGLAFSAGLALAPTDDGATAPSLAFTPARAALAVTFLFLSAALGAALDDRPIAATFMGCLVALGSACWAWAAAVLLAEGWPTQVEMTRAILAGAVVPLLLFAVVVMAHLRGNATFDPKRFAERLTLAGLVLLFVGVTAWLVVGRATGQRRLDTAIDRWERDVLSSDAPPALAARPSSPAALRADEIAGRLGARLRPRIIGERAERRAPQPAALTQALSALFEGPTTRASERLLPRPIEELLAARSADLATLHDVLLPGGITWEIEPVVRGVRPDEHGHEQIATLLAASALAHERSGDRAAAWRDLESIRALTTGLRQHGSIQAVAAATELSRIHARVARELGSLPPGWIDQENALAFRRQEWEARVHDASMGIDVTRGNAAPYSWSGDPTPLMRAALVAWSPLSLREAAAELDHQARLALRFRRRDACAVLQQPEPPSLGAIRQPVFDFVDGFRSSETGLRRLTRLEQEWELTRRVHGLRAWREANGGPDAHVPQDLAASSICPALPWQVELRGERGFVVTSSEPATDASWPAPAHVEPDG